MTSGLLSDWSYIRCVKKKEAANSCFLHLLSQYQPFEQFWTAQVSAIVDFLLAFQELQLSPNYRFRACAI